MKKERFTLVGLKKCLERFDEDGRHAQYGKWSIGKGGYDLLWELYYENQPVFDCERSVSEVYDANDTLLRTFRVNELYKVNDYGKCNLDEVAKKIMSVYSDVQYYGFETIRKKRRKKLGNKK